MVYPKGTKFGNYFIATEAGRFFIRRQVTLPDGGRKSPRYPINKYSNLSSLEEISQLVNRLNYREDQKAKRAIEIKTSFIPSALLEEFRAQLKLEIPNAKDFRYQYNTVLMRYFLDFFVNRLQLLDPNQWHQNQSKWGAALIGEADDSEHNMFEKRMSHKTIIRSIQVANRFMAFLHVKNPEEYRKYSFEPISRAALNNYKATSKLSGEGAKGIGQYIPADDWKVIKAECPAQISPYINIMYHYGLRRAESMGFTSIASVRKGYVLITQQLKNMGESPVYGPLKNRKVRQVEHWFASPAEACRWIEDGMHYKAHPDTLSLRIEKFMKLLFKKKKIKTIYETHDFRRTFITNALRLKDPIDIMKAVGHASLSTTMGYMVDDRDLDDEPFKPEAS